MELTPISRAQFPKCAVVKTIDDKTRRVRDAAPYGFVVFHKIFFHAFCPKPANERLTSNLLYVIMI